MESVDEDLTYNIQELIIRTRLEMETDFQEGKEKKSVLWEKVLLKIKEIKPGFEMTKEQIIRKYSNLLTTYKRIKDRNNKTGRNTTSWEFYDMFNEVYETKHAINPPSRNLQSSLNTSITIKDEEPDWPPILNEPLSCSNILPEEPCSQKKKRKICEENELLEFLREEAKRDDQRHKEIMELEERKMEMEQERIKAMIGLKNIFQQMIKK